MKQSKTKMYITLPVELANAFRSFVPKGKRSAFIAEAIEFYIRICKQREALAQGFGAWKDENHPDLKMPEDTVKWVNSLRALDNERLEELNKQWHGDSEE